MDIDRLIARYRRAGVILDTNILLMLAVGSFDSNYISQHKNTKDFSVEDFHLLVSIVDQIDRVVATPNIITETDNLVRQNPRGQDIRTQVRELISVIHEVPIASIKAVQSERYPGLGVADCATLLASDGVLVITTDSALHVALLENERDAVNFNHLREEFGILP
ncbi:hypothetical protein [Blastochloris sulfoviridis]|uniref:PIN domain-containing protein n=1 Tax=Blastochloris sulfoviridis TaxID=50712 RepID=A0A5M6I2A9_9HYPH|nr:hypothetical protein [Blastochloris sulfoviridis]KAA5601928.1 hypothetical protein F1193_08370 [Blastochloris sulfoviridis]